MVVERHRKQDPCCSFNHHTHIRHSHNTAVTHAQSQVAISELQTCTMAHGTVSPPCCGQPIRHCACGTSSHSLSRTRLGQALKPHQVLWFFWRYSGTAAIGLTATLGRIGMVARHKGCRAAALPQRDRIDREPPAPRRSDTGTTDVLRNSHRSDWFSADAAQADTKPEIQSASVGRISIRPARMPDGGCGTRSNPLFIGRAVPPMVAMDMGETALGGR